MELFVTIFQNHLLNSFLASSIEDDSIENNQETNSVKSAPISSTFDLPGSYSITKLILCNHEKNVISSVLLGCTK